MSVPHPIEGVADRGRGALVGVAVGDVLGAPFEGAVSVPEGFADTVSTPQGYYTDDTAMTIGVARSLVACDGFDGAHMAETLAGLFHAEPWRGYGAGPPRIFAAMARGARWDEPANELFGGSGSYGNGAAMRVAPVAVAALGDHAAVARLAARTAGITHTHPLGIDGAVAQAVSVAVLAEQEDPHPGEVVESVRPHLATVEFADALATAADLALWGDDAEARRRLGNGVAALRSVPTALYCALAHSQSFPAAVTAAVAMGGDADTIGAMTGALAGARHGLGGIPPEWRAVEGSDELIRLADRLRGG